MTILGSVQDASYPVYQVEIVVNGTENGNTFAANTMSYYVSSLQASGPGGDMTQQIFEAVKTWAENYDWAQYNGYEGSTPISYSFGSVTVTEATGSTEQTSNVSLP